MEELNPQRPFTLTDTETSRVHRLVGMYLPSEYDREYVADTIILHSWLRGVDHISHDYVRHKCISAWRQMQRERRKNEESLRLTPKETPNEEEFVDRKVLVEEAVGCLSTFERKLIWMRYYDGQKLEEIAEMVTLRRDEIQQALKIALYKMRVHLT